MKSKIVFSSVSGTTQQTAQNISKFLHSNIPSFDSEILNISLLSTDALNEELVFLLLVVNTWIDGNPSPDASAFSSALTDLANDFRVDKNFYSNVRYSVLGIGDDAYSNFCLFPRNLDAYLLDLGAIRISPSFFVDKDNSASIQEWQNLVLSNYTSYNGSIVSVKNPIQYQFEEDVELESEDQKSDDELVDVEEIGAIASAGLTASKNQQDENDGIIIVKKRTGISTSKELITPNLRVNLEKQGYKLVGTQYVFSYALSFALIFSSAVKMCRWTKSQLRNRGGCYKHTFYGIESHRCMETTPSLACANKCVFCWRHQTNPVATSWKWKADDPLEIIEGAITKHTSMVKMMRGVPGVTKERFDEGLDVRHCALSLVGEPIMYPYINEFVEELHRRKISSFLVTNAQFPELIRKLSPVTQLYLSIDASTRDALKKIDRPLFSDFWDRFNACLDEIRDKKQRTVFRLTLVKGYNVDEVLNYAGLVERGKPDFIEVKGVTFCGYKGSNPLTMTNVPFHEEVVDFVKLLCNELPDYEIACEHVIAHTKFKVGGVWNTWIDYEKFHYLVNSGRDFDALEYSCATPEWAVFGDGRKGFDPEMERFYRNKAKYDGDPEGYKESLRLARMSAAAEK